MALEKSREGYKMRNTELYSQLAKAITYPSLGYRETVLNCQKLIESNYDGASKSFALLTEFISSNHVERLEEAYTVTFDINAVCALDVGYQLFGEDYKRGALLVELNRLHRDAQMDTGRELADHLPNLLKVLPSIKDPVERGELAQKIILPALEKMLASFPQGTDNIYFAALKAIHHVLETDFGAAIPFPIQPDYLGEVEEAMNV